MQEFAGKLTGTGMRNYPRRHNDEILLRMGGNTGHLLADLHSADHLMTGPD
jgi:hypothetical protein